MFGNFSKISTFDANEPWLAALTLCVRGFTEKQIADGFFAGDARKAARAIQQGLDRKMLVTRRLLIRDFPILDAPWFVWEPFQKGPKLQKLVFLCRQRTERVKPRLTTVVHCGPMAVKLFGGKYQGRFKRPLQGSHDIGTASLYLAVRRDRPELAACWYGEDMAPKQIGQVADAVCLDKNRKPFRAFEFCGLYSAKRLQRFHQGCVERRLPYELW